MTSSLINITRRMARVGVSLLRGLLALGAVGLFFCVTLSSQAQSTTGTIFDIVLQDDSSGDILRFSSTTGVYQFSTSRASTVTMSGTGTTISHGCTISLQDFGWGHRVLASVDTHANRGFASMKMLSLGVTTTITARMPGNCCFELPPLPDHGVIIPLYTGPLSNLSDLSPDCDEPDLPISAACDRDSRSVRKKISIGWQRVINAKRAYPSLEVWVVIDPLNGPNASDDTIRDYNIGMCELKKAKIGVLGYVCTKHAGQSDTCCGCDDRCKNCVPVNEQKIKDDIDTWKTKYDPAPDGIFFDEMANLDGDSPDPDPMDATKFIQRVAFYTAVSDYAEMKGFKFRVGNPGALTTKAFADTVGTVIVYESAGFPSSFDYTKLAAISDSPSRFGILAYDVMQPPDRGNSAFIAAKNHVRYIYVTSDGSDGNPWDNIPCAGVPTNYLARLFARLLGDPDPPCFPPFCF